MAKFGQLYLNNGKWNGNQIVPFEWVANSTTPLDIHVQPNAGDEFSSDAWGYGYQWWVPGPEVSDYTAHGIYNQFIYINPDVMGNDQNEIYSKVVRAGKRTYFFDIKATKGNDLYLTLTESKKTYNEDGESSYQKHKIFLYKEDFEKFKDGLDDVLNKIEELKNQ